MYISCNHVVIKLLNTVLLPRKFLATANSAYDFYLIGLKADDPATYGTYRSLPVNLIDAWQIGGLSSDMNRRVENAIKRFA